MEKDNKLFCPLLRAQISEGLCAEIMAVSTRTLKQSAVPEISQFSQEQIVKACEDCPYLNEKLP